MLEHSLSLFALQIEQALGLTIVMVPIDECVRERCESGGCSNTLVVGSEPVIINTNGTSMIGVNMSVKAECVCRAKVFNTSDDMFCRPGRCLNGGKCIQRKLGYT